MQALAKVRVLFTHPSAELYGSDRMAVETVAALCDAGAETTVVLPEGGPAVDRFSAAGSRVRILLTFVARKDLLSVRRVGGALLGGLLSLVRCIRAVRQIRPDVVYVNTIIQPVWLIACFILRVPVICHVREAEANLPKALRLAMLAPLVLASMIITNSYYSRKVILRDFPALRPRVIYNGKDWSGFLEIVAAPLSSGRIVCVGRLSPRKGQDLIVDALVLLRLEGINVAADFVGAPFDGYEWFEEELRAKVQAAGLRQQVTFSGFVEDVSAHLRRASMAVVPSRVEPFGTVAAECMAAGLPTIVSGTDGLLEIIDGADVGRTFVSGDARSLADAIRGVLSLENPENLVRAGRDAVTSRFSLPRYRLEVVSAVTGLLA